MARSAALFLSPIKTTGGPISLRGHFGFIGYATISSRVPLIRNLSFTLNLENNIEHSMKATLKARDQMSSHKEPWYDL